MVAVEYGLSNLISSLRKKDREKQWKAYLSDQYVFVYLWTRSELLRDLDLFRELSLDLSKRNRAVPEVCVIVALLVDLMNDQVSSLSSTSCPPPVR